MTQETEPDHLPGTSLHGPVQDNVSSYDRAEHDPMPAPTPWSAPGELDELEYHWGSAYHLAIVAGIYTARRRDGKGAALADALPEGLRLRIQADYAALPVPRDLPGTPPERRDAITCLVLQSGFVT